jgi:hypothetical protein
VGVLVAFGDAAHVRVATAALQLILSTLHATPALFDALQTPPHPARDAILAALAALFAPGLGPLPLRAEDSVLLLTFCSVHLHAGSDAALAALRPFVHSALCASLVRHLPPPLADLPPLSPLVAALDHDRNMVAVLAAAAVRFGARSDSDAAGTLLAALCAWDLDACVSGVEPLFDARRLGTARDALAHLRSVGHALSVAMLAQPPAAVPIALLAALVPAALVPDDVAHLVHRVRTTPFAFEQSCSQHVTLLTMLAFDALP